MNGAQDLGGAMGFGRVEHEPDEPWFHAEWERRAFAVTLAIGAAGRWPLDESRHARESLHPADYLSSSYYEIWVKGLEKLVTRHDLVSPEELARGDHPLEPLAGDEVVVDAVVLAGASRARRVGARQRDVRRPLDELLDDRRLAGPRRGRDDEEPAAVPVGPATQRSAPARASARAPPSCPR